MRRRLYHPGRSWSVSKLTPTNHWDHSTHEPKREVRFLARVTAAAAAAVEIVGLIWAEFN